MREKNFENLCFAYVPDRDTCRALKEKEPYCNTPFCPFYKSNKQYREELVKIRKRVKDKGYDSYY